jgi:penicillin-binding protein 2
MLLHIYLGYIAEVNPKQIETSDAFYRMGDYVGQTGLESVYEEGTDGATRRTIFNQG